MRKFKQISIVLILTVGMILSSNAQINKAPVKPPQKFESFCTTPPGQNIENIELMSQIVSSSNYIDLSDATACVKLYFHVIRQTNGTGGVNATNVNTSFAILNNDFNPHDIYFSWDGTIDYINNTTYYNNPNYGGSENTPPAIFSVNNHIDGVDIYIFNDIGSSNSGLANGVGGSSELFVAGTLFGAVLSRSHVISHELGHVLGLWHTHHGTFTENGWYGWPADPNQCPELVNGSNAHICGDYVMDTPADRHLQFNVDLSCNWLGYGVDANGQLFNPDETNYMAYTKPNCMQHFSDGQATRMFYAMLNLPHLQDVSNVSLYPLQAGINICDGFIVLDFEISPNPVNKMLNLNINDGFNSNSYIISIYNQFNHTLYSDIIKNTNHSIDISKLPNGIYYVIIENDYKSIAKTLLINH